MTNKIVVVGSTNTDMVIHGKYFPKPGETVLGGGFFMNQGGKGANQAVASARMGGQVSFISRVGNDVFGEQALLSLKKEGIDTTHVIIDPNEPSGIAQIIVDDSGENSIVVAPGANMRVSKDDIDSAMNLIYGSDIVLMQLEIPLETVIYAASAAYNAGKKVILNPAPAVALSDELLHSLHSITPNESEAELLTGVKVMDISSAETAAKILRAKGVNIVIITLGANGAYISTETLQRHISAPKVNAIDTTAAGDTFNGALAVALSQNKSVTEAVSFANYAAALAVTRMGAQSSVPSLEEVKKFIERSGLANL